MKIFWIIMVLLVIGFGSDESLSFLVKNPSKLLYPAIFNFGDSNSDTGAYSATFARVPYPYGSTFFGGPSGRLSNGRIFIDFIAEKLGLPYLNAYLDAMSSDFKHGVNFAVALGTIKPADMKHYGYGINPISLNLQLLQFQQFKNRVEELHKRDKTSSVLKTRFPIPEDFSKALYSIDIGQNDLSLLVAISPEDRVFKTLPQLIGIFSNAIEELYELGARSFLIHNTGPLGCLPTSIDLFKSEPEKLDEIGCVKSYNNVAKEFNRLLEEKVSQFETKFNDSSILRVDMYSTKYALFQDAKKYGFIDPHGYCCKECVKFYVPIWQRDVSNNVVSYKFCDDPSKYISWDGSHYTEAANHLIANQLFNDNNNNTSFV